MPLPNGFQFPDTSRYRTVCNWNGFHYPIASCKASEGATHRDSSFPSWLNNMRARGKYPIPYHFLRREQSIASQVSNYLGAVSGEFGVMLDLETSGSGTNPTIAQADEWCDRVQAATGLPRSRMLLYMPRWWYNAYGGGSRALADLILWNSQYSSNPNLSPFAGDNIEILQYSSTAPIAGLCSPGTGDQNIAINMSAQQFLDKITGTTIPPEDTLSAAEVAEIKAHINDKGPYLAADLDSHPAYWVVYKQTGEKRWVNTFTFLAMIGLERILYNGVDPAGFAVPFPRSKDQLDQYVTVGPVPDGW